MKRPQQGERSTLDRALSHVRANIHRGVTGRETAEQVGRSVSWLCHALRRRTGKTFSRYLLDLRVREAERLLARTSLPVAEVGRACGFPRPGYFSARFRKAAGMSPRRYRDLHRLPAAARPPGAAPGRETPLLAEDFPDDALQKRWSATVGDWQVGDGTLTGKGTGDLFVWLRREVPPGFRVEFETMRTGEAGRSAAAALLLTLSDGTGRGDSGYRLRLGRDSNLSHTLLRCDRIVALTPGALAYDTWHRIELAFSDEVLRVRLDGEEIFTHVELLPIPWRSRSRFSVGGWDLSLQVRRFRAVSISPGPATKRSAQGDAHFAEGNLEEALEAYEEELRAVERSMKRTPRATTLKLKTGMTCLGLGLSIRGAGYLERFAAESGDTIWKTMAEMEALGVRLRRLPDNDLEERAREIIDSAETPGRARLVFGYLMERGGRLGAAGEYEKAALLARLAASMTRIDPGAAGRASRQTVDCLLSLGRYDEAISFARETEKENRFLPTHTDQVRILKAVALGATGRFREAHRSLDAIGGGAGRAIEAQREQHRAVLLQGEGRLDEALAAFSALADSFRDVELLSLSARVASALLLAVAGRWKEAESAARKVSRDSDPDRLESRVLLRRALLAIRGDYDALRRDLEERALGRREPGRSMIRDEVLLGAIRELTGDRDRATRSLQALERSLGEGRWWHYVLPASFLLGKAPAEEVRRNTVDLCLFAPDLSSSSLFYMLSRVLAHREDEAGAKELLRYAVEVDPMNYWPAILARRELGTLTPRMKRFLTGGRPAGRGKRSR